MQRYVREVRPGRADLYAWVGRHSTSPRISSPVRPGPTPLMARRPAAGEAPAERHGQVQGQGLRAARRDVANRAAVDAPHGPLATANVNENFIHHEDVRRASGEGPRAIDDEMDAILWRMLGFGARMSKKAVKGAALTLRTPDGRERVVSTDGAAGSPGRTVCPVSSVVHVGRPQRAPRRAVRRGRREGGL